MNNLPNLLNFQLNSHKYLNSLSSPPVVALCCEIVTLSRDQLYLYGQWMACYGNRVKWGRERVNRDTEWSFIQL